MIWIRYKDYDYGRSSGLINPFINEFNNPHKIIIIYNQCYIFKHTFVSQFCNVYRYFMYFNIQYNVHCLYNQKGIILIIDALLNNSKSSMDISVKILYLTLYVMCYMALTYFTIYLFTISTYLYLYFR